MSRVFLLLFLLCAISISCQENGDGETLLVGKWKLTEELFDPGDGSGVFHATTRNMTIDFRNDNRFAASENMCASTTGDSSTGTYSLDDGTISPDNCSAQGLTIRFTMEGNNLIISYPCIEPCKQKFVRV